MTDISKRIRAEEAALTEMVLLSKSGSQPGDWPEPYRKIFAQAALPVLQPLHNLARPVPRAEHAKGLLLAYHYYAQQMVHPVLERLPEWIVREARREARSTRLEIAAERIRHNLIRRIGHHGCKHG